MFSKLGKIFKLSNWKRWIISSISLISMLLAISLGSIYSLNNRATNDYKTGAEIVLKITNIDETPEVIKRQVQQRLDLTLSDDSHYEVILNSDDFLTIRGTNIETDEEMNNFKSFIADKETISVTNLTLGIDGKPEILPFQFSDSTMSNETITLNLDNHVVTTGDILIWRNLSELIDLATTMYNDEWTSVNRDPYKFLFINGVTESTENGPQPILKNKAFGGFDATDYLISKNSFVEGGFKNSIVLDFSFAPKITKKEKEEIFYNLDFSVSSYNLDLQTYNFIQPSLGTNAYQFLMIAGIVSFSFVSIFLVVNYGLLGALSTICAAFLIFLGLLMITVFRGEYSPETIAALMIAIGIGLDFNIAFFSRFKKELKQGNSLEKSLKKADKLTFSSSLTKALSLIITSTIIYVIGSLYLGTFSSLILIMSIFMTLIMFGLIRILTTLILQTKVFDNKPKLFGIYKKNDNLFQNAYLDSNEINSLNENEVVNDDGLSGIKSKKVTILKRISVISLGLVAIVGTTLFTTFSVLNSSWLSGFNANGSLTNPIILKSKNPLNETEANNFKTLLENQLGLDSGEINIKKISQLNDEYLLEVSTTKKIDDNQILEIQNQGLILINYSMIAENANKSILNIFYIALASIIAMSIFVLIRSDWSYALSMFLTLVIAIVLFTLLFTFQIFSFNTFFIFGMSAAILLAISNNITVLFRIKEKLKNKKTEELTKDQLKKISNSAVKDSFSRLLISNGLMMLTLIIFTVFPGASNISFTIPLAIFIVISLIISTVIVPFFFNIFKAFKSKRKRNKIIENYWETQRIQEQIFPAINDIK